MSQLSYLDSDRLLIDQTAQLELATVDPKWHETGNDDLRDRQDERKEDVSTMAFNFLCFFDARDKLASCG
mgnify:FL=1